jgi:hypothetical protein
VTEGGPSIKSRIKSLRVIYEEAQKRIDRQLQRAALTPFQEFRLGEHKRQIDAVISALSAEIESISSRAAQQAYRQGVNLALAALRRQGVALSRIDMGNRLHTGAIQVVADQMAMDLLGANGALGDHARRVLRQARAAKRPQRARSR